MQISNPRRIIVEDFPKESRPVVEKLATVINSFQEEVVTLTQGNIGIDNLNRSIVSIDVVTDATGKPQALTQINTQLSSFSGHKIINVQSINGGDPVISTPYLDCTFNGSNAVKVNKFYGLAPSKKLRITIEFIG